MAFQRRFIDSVVKILRFYVADAVFTGDRAAEIDGELERFGDAFAGTGYGVKVVAVNDKIYMDIAIARMAEIGDEGVVPLANLFDRCNKFGNL